VAPAVDVEAWALRLDSLAGAAQQLPAGALRPAEDGGCLGVGVGEHIVEQQRRPLLGRQRFQNDEERHRQRLGQHGSIGSVRCRVPEHRLGQPRSDVALAAHTRRAEVVDGGTGRDRRQVGDHAGDVVGHRTAGLLQRRLDDVLGVAHRAEHPVGDGEQPRSGLDRGPFEAVDVHDCDHAATALLGVDWNAIEARFHRLITPIAPTRSATSFAENSAVAASHTSSGTPSVPSRVTASVRPSAARSRSVKLSVWAERQGVHYMTAWRWWKAGTLPVRAHQTESGTILVDVSAVAAGARCCMPGCRRTINVTGSTRRWGGCRGGRLSRASSSMRSYARLALGSTGTAANFIGC
jgi:hypothetical protein